jgi:hemolysin III
VTAARRRERRCGYGGAVMMAGDEARSGPDPIGAARDAAEAAGERFDQARADAGERFDQARTEAGERLGAARDAASRGAASARARAEAAAGAIPKPRLRGVSHQWAFFCSLVAGAALVILAPDGEATFAASIYAVSLSALLGVSALYHRVNWRPAARRWMRRLDHTMIFLLIAGTYTPFALLVLHGALSEIVLIAVWAFAGAGVILNLAWWNAPKPVTAGVYLSTGWIAVVAFPQLWDGLGPVGFGLLALGGALYTAGAIVYARRSPDPRPEVFGYHEIFHLLVIVAAACQFAAVAIYALPAG